MDVWMAKDANFFFFGKLIKDAIQNIPEYWIKYTWQTQRNKKEKKKGKKIGD